MQTWACRRPKSQLLPWTCLRRNHGLAFGFSVGLLSVQLIHPGVTHGFVSRDHIWRACVGGEKLKVKCKMTRQRVKTAAARRHAKTVRQHAKTQPKHDILSWHAGAEAEHVDGPPPFKEHPFPPSRGL